MIKSVEANIEKIRRSIVDEEKRLEEIDNGRSILLQQEIETKRQEANNLQQRLTDAQVKMRELRESADEARRIADGKRHPLLAQQNEVEQAEARLNQLKRNKDHQRSGFNPNMPTLLRAIENDIGSFSMRPVGPLGHHVRLKEPKWSSILEQTFGGALSSFVVTSKRDMNTLQRIMQRTQWYVVDGHLLASFSIPFNGEHILTKFSTCPIFIASDTSPLDTSAHEPDTKYDTILRVLEVSSG